MVTNNAINTQMPIQFSKGGTGVATTTAYGVLTGGTSATGPIQNTGTGTTGQILVSNGASALPTWQDITAQNISINVRVFEIAGTFTYTPTSGMQYCIVEAIGGGGGGAGCAAGGSGYAAGAGGGGGAYVKKAFLASDIGVSQSLTVGAQGLGATGTATSTNGGITTFGAFLTAYGGVGGTGANTSTSGTVNPGPSGGATATGGDTNVFGENGEIGFQGVNPGGTSGFVSGGNGGFTIYGKGGFGTTVGSGSTVNGGNAPAGQYGSGGGGASSNKGASQGTGGNGATGVIVITEYIF